MFRDAKAYLERRALRKDLAQLINVVSAHKAADLPAGHKYYKALWNKARERFDKYRVVCVKLGLPEPTFDSIAMGVPSLLEMERLASGRTTSIGSVLLPALVGLPIVLLAITAAFALSHDFYLFLTHWANIHWMVH